MGIVLMFHQRTGSMRARHKVLKSFPKIVGDKEILVSRIEDWRSMIASME